MQDTFHGYGNQQGHHDQLIGLRGDKRSQHRGQGAIVRGALRGMVHDMAQIRRENFPEVFCPGGMWSHGAVEGGITVRLTRRDDQFVAGVERLLAQGPGDGRTRA